MRTFGFSQSWPPPVPPSDGLVRPLRRARREDDPALFPTEAIRLAYDAILSEPKAAAKALPYSTPEGDPDLRAWIAEDMRRRGVRCAAENVLIVNGAQQALDFIGKLFLFAGDIALTSRPTFLGALQAVRLLRATIRRTAAAW